jgi:hypothetical protein
MIKQIIEEIQNNHEFGKPWKWGDKAAGLLVPILRTTPSNERQYIMLEEAKEKVTIEDTGHIGAAKLVNQSGKTVFVRGGAVLAGQGTQSRAVQTGTVVQPGKQEVPINCIHASHHIQAQANFNFQGYAPRRVEKALRQKNQGEVWGAVSSYHSSAMCMSSMSASPQAFRSTLSSVRSDNLVETMQTVNNFKTDINDAIRRMPRELNQVGVVILDINGVAGLELFDSPDSWKALCENVVKQYAEVLEQKLPDYLTVDMDKAIVNIRAFLDLAKECTEQPEQNNTVILNGKVSGEYTKLNDVVIHLLLAREEKQNHAEIQPQGPIFGHGNSNPVWRSFIPTQISHYESRPQGLSLSNINSTEPIHSFLEQTNSKDLLKGLRDKPMTWKEMTPIFKSTHTQTRRLTEAQSLGLVEKDNKTYRLSARGQSILNNKKK